MTLAKPLGSTPGQMPMSFFFRQQLNSQKQLCFKGQVQNVQSIFNQKGATVMTIDR